MYRQVIKKIFLIGPSYPFKGGIAHYTTLLYRHLKKKYTTRFFAFKKQYPSFLFPGNTDKDTSENPLIEEGTELILNSFNPLTWCKIAIITAKEKPHVLLFPWWNYYWAPHELQIVLLKP